jgi:hypothetical protein
MRYSATLTFAVTVALLLSACAESPPPVTAEKLLDLRNIQPVVNAVALSPDGSLVAVGDMEGELVARELPSGTERWKGRVAAGRVDGLIFSADGSLLATTAHESRTMELWQVLTGRQVAVLDIRDSRTAAFHPTEPALVVGAGGNLYVVDAERGQITRTLPNAHSGDRVYAAAFSSDGQILVTASHEGALGLGLLASPRAPGGDVEVAEAMAPVSLVLGRQGAPGETASTAGCTSSTSRSSARSERSTTRPAGHGLHGDARSGLTHDSDCFSRRTRMTAASGPETRRGKTYLFRGDVPFYKAMSISVPAGLVALLHPGDDQGRGPYGLEVWRLTYR